VRASALAPSAPGCVNTLPTVVSAQRKNLPPWRTFSCANAACPFCPQSNRVPSASVRRENGMERCMNTLFIFAIGTVAVLGGLWLTGRLVLQRLSPRPNSQ
jgi:hypothetical protein